MRIFTLAARCAAVWFFVASCTRHEPRGSGSTGSGSTGSGSTGSGSTGSGSTGSGGVTPAAIIDNFCKAVMDPFCEAEPVCCKSVLHKLSYSVEVCKSWFENPPTFALYCNGPLREAAEAALASGETVFDQAQFDVCLARLKPMAAGGAACVSSPEYVFHMSCATAFRGQVPAGDACGWPADWPVNDDFPCKDGVCKQGICVPFLKPGDACQVGQYHPSPVPVSELCNPFQGQACIGAPAPAADGGGGGDGGAPAMGTCGPQGEIGDVCHPGNNHECRSLYCDATGTCALPDPTSTACFGY